MACTVCGGTRASTAMVPARPAQLASRAAAPVASNETVKSADGRHCSSCAFVPSCETQEALAGCVKKVFCDVLRCLGDLAKTSLDKPKESPPPVVVNADGATQTQSTKVTDDLLHCVLTAVVSFAECVPDALCGPRVTPPLLTDDLPCDFAVEEQLSVKVSSSGH